MSGEAFPLLPVVALLFGIGVFVGLAVWLLRPGAARAARRHAEIPFHEEPPGTAGRGGEGPRP